MASSNNGTSMNKNLCPWRISKVLMLSNFNYGIFLLFSDILKKFVHCPMLCTDREIHIFIIPSHKSFLQYVRSEFDFERLSVETHGLDKITRRNNVCVIYPISCSDFFLFKRRAKNEELFRVFDTEMLSRYHVILEVKLEDIQIANNESSTRAPRVISLRQSYPDKRSEKVLLPQTNMGEPITIEFQFDHTQVSSHQQNPEDLNEAGFVNTGPGDLVRCFSCGLCLKDFDTATTPYFEHARYSPDCELLKNLIGESEVSEIKRAFNLTDPNFYRRSMGGENYEIQSQYLHPEYQRLQDRLATFYLWPSGVAQTPNQLSKAGFYYPGYEDEVRCFSCNGGFKSLERTDDPWTEHCRWFPNCLYANEVKGREQIASVQSITEAEFYSKMAGGADSDITAANGESSLEENKRLKSFTVCRMCNENDCNVLFLPCGHREVCMSCAKSLIKCLMCGRSIREKIRTYFKF